MNYSLRHFLSFVTCISLALAFTQVTPLLSFTALVVGIGLAFHLLEQTVWRFLVCCALFGIGIYAITFTTLAEVLAPPETATSVKDVSEHRAWVESTKPLLHHTSIPIGALFGLTAGIGYLQFCRMREKSIRSVHRFLLYAALIVSMIGMVGALDYSISHSYMVGKLLVIEFAGETPALYPPNSDRLFALQFTNTYFAISCPLLFCMCLMTLGVHVYAARRRKRLLSIRS